MKNVPDRNRPMPQWKSGIPVFVLLLLFAAMYAPAAAAQTQLEVRGIDGGRAILSLDADPLRTMTPTPFHLVLTDEAGDPITGAEVRCDLTMPAMPMPENSPAVREEEGSYEGEAVFTMAGAWQASFRITMPDERVATLVFDLQRVLLK